MEAMLMQLGLARALGVGLVGGGLSYAPITRDTRGIVTTGRWNYAAVAKVGGL